MQRHQRKPNLQSRKKQHKLKRPRQKFHLFSRLRRRKAIHSLRNSKYCQNKNRGPIVQRNKVSSRRNNSKFDIYSHDLFTNTHHELTFRSLKSVNINNFLLLMLEEYCEEKTRRSKKKNSLSPKVKCFAYRFGCRSQ